jgi:cytochrome P450
MSTKVEFLDGLIQPLQQTCDHALKASIPPCPDWTLVNGQMLLWPLISRLITLALLGPELASSEEWFGVVMAYFQAGRSALQRIRDEYQPWLRWAAKYFDNDVKAIYAARRRGEEILKPVIEARIADAIARASNGQQQPGFNDGIQWLVDSYKAENKPVKASEIMQDVAFLLAASLESTTVNALSILFDLVERPESVAEIRKEASTVYAEHGGWNRQSLAALRTLDSFLKESQRLNTFQFSTSTPTSFS